ncbi:MAG TPA: ATP-binding protein [Steroidobacteraceae bacterium]|nr:ATP-binding protein [Steroidobacteraceae bacterium]
MAERGARPRARLAFEQRITILTVALALPAMLLGAALLYWVHLGQILRVCLLIVLVLVIGAIAALLREAIVQPLRGLANVIEAYRAGDYTVRGRRASGRDALGELAGEINDLGRTLHEQRLKAMEATALLEKLINSIDVAVFAFDSAHQLRLANPAAARLLDVPPDFAMGRSATEVALEEFLEDAGGTRIVASVAGHGGRWQVTHGTFRESGLAQHLLIVADLRQALRDEERLAWQRLIRVIGHEVNNSLTPIRSLAETLRDLVAEALTAGRTRDDALDALDVIADRTDSLGRFLAQYSRLARLPPPKARWVELRTLLGRVAALDPAYRVDVKVDEHLEACVDEDQLEQALINLMKNAVEAQGDDSRPITLVAEGRGDTLAIAVRDSGPGIANPDNLFVPFFTTKPGGSGVGLALSRQIAEGHGGTLSLENRRDTRGAVATLEIPGAARVRA